MRHGRHNLHIAMNVLEALVKERMPVSDTLILDFRSRHEQLTAKVDKLANAMRARVDFWANLNVVKSVKIVRRASFLAQSAEDLRAAVQRASDIARNLRLGNGQLTHYTTDSRLSLLSAWSYVSTPSETGTSGASPVEEEDPDITGHRRSSFSSETGSMVVLQAVHHDTSINEQVSVASPPLVPTNTVEEVQENDSHETTAVGNDIYTGPRHVSTTGRDGSIISLSAATRTIRNDGSLADPGMGNRLTGPLCIIRRISEADSSSVAHQDLNFNAEEIMRITIEAEFNPWRD